MPVIKPGALYRVWVDVWMADRTGALRPEDRACRPRPLGLER